MNKNSGMWFTLIAICVIGIAITFYTNRFVAKQEESLGVKVLREAEIGTETAFAEALNESYLEQDEAEHGIEAPAAVDASPLTAEDAQMPVVDYAEESPVAEIEINQEVSEDENTAMIEILPAETVISPLGTGVDTPKEKSRERMKDTRAHYEDHLAELEEQTRKLREVESNATPHTMKATAENELKLWDAELNAIYSSLIGCLSENESQELIKQEREWIQYRDAKALKDAKKYSGGTLEGLEYAASLSKSTRERTYLLVEQYLNLLENQ